MSPSFINFIKVSQYHQEVQCKYEDWGNNNKFLGCLNSFPSNKRLKDLNNELCHQLSQGFSQPVPQDSRTRVEGTVFLNMLVLGTIDTKSYCNWIPKQCVPGASRSSPSSHLKGPQAPALIYLHNFLYMLRNLDHSVLPTNNFTFFLLHFIGHIITFPSLVHNQLRITHYLVLSNSTCQKLNTLVQGKAHNAISFTKPSLIPPTKCSLCLPKYLLHNYFFTLYIFYFIFPFFTS